MSQSPSPTRRIALEKGTSHNVTISRSYQDGDDWKETISFGRDDLPLVAKAVDMAHTWIFQPA